MATRAGAYAPPQSTSQVERAGGSGVGGAELFNELRREKGAGVEGKGNGKGGREGGKENANII